jgi:hypothetical protein
VLPRRLVHLPPPIAPDSQTNPPGLMVAPATQLAPALSD